MTFKSWHFWGVGFLILWLGGFLVFVYNIPRTVSDTTTTTDGIVVLTGRKGRVQLGFQLVQQGLGRKLLISGVHPAVKMSALLNHQHVEALDSTAGTSAELGYQAKNTLGNAKEAALWVEQNHIQSLRLVTTNYHMIRSLLHFRYYLPASLIILPHPIMEKKAGNTETVILLIGEYHKFLRDYVKLKWFLRK
ncbi:YdcF family protein [Candidatus Finniella inopinata]|uniref:YdcF family protein n=1 Tax=Candidatus Finniella inopinata TaxID=1696036 RepID=A0A4Q7DKY4_9PROT|nr:YdcF family protein [Candidatus Finniella inopinata]RZI47060.1 YdcF family protein [Candidatus Finniella inopinata]